FATRRPSADSAPLGNLERPVVLHRNRQILFLLVRDHRPVPPHADVERLALVADRDRALVDVDPPRGHLLADAVPHGGRALLTLGPRRAFVDDFLDDARHLEIGPDGHRGTVEDVDATDRDKNPDERLHPDAPGRYTQIFAAAGRPSAMVWPSPDAVIVPAQGATSVIFRRRPGRTSFFQRCS